MAENKFSNSGHIYASIGAAVGVANLVLFPARVFSYGGLAFIVVFIISTLLLGYPLMVGEIALGKHGQSNAVDSYTKIGGKKWSWAGKFGLITTSVILSFYIIIAGWSLYYLFQFAFNFSDIENLLFESLQSKTPARTAIAKMFVDFSTNSSKVILYSGAFMALTIFIVAQKISAGIEKIGKIFVPLLIVLLIILFVFINVLEGKDLNFSNFNFDASKLFSMTSTGGIGFIEAVGQAFFSLSLGACSMITFGNHLKKKTNVTRNAHYIVHTDTLVALLAALLIIPLFIPTSQIGINPGLVFISLVDTFISFGFVWGKVVGILFFFLFNIAILTSAVSLLEPTVNYYSKNQERGRQPYAIVIGIVVFIVAIPSILSFNPNAPALFRNFLGYGSGGAMGFFNFVIDFFGTFCILLGGL
ncbi:sodium-dependent transporter [Luteibaculum oceani]|uniref:Sodium-dependent transporter n=1 Tax=Luteibaculum oceani TaxID=1294296 RepID=A0A5C6USN2_9FLAO|nr:sodium-dependent transporter [Luteibaculum oceani]TXC76267.1 hypothetical protein FRX97_11005 [Luteibaculum oceani]